MSKPDFTLKFVKDAQALLRLSDTLIALPAFALDIETTDWWNRHRERIAIIQIAFRTEGRVRVVIIDALAGFDLEPLRLPLEQSSTLTIIHNAAFDATRLEKHFGFNVAPVFDTMLAARRSGERKYSLKTQAQMYLNLQLDKSAQGSDWSLRPLDARQLHYAALDPYATLLLYENQAARNLSGEYRSKPAFDAAQSLLPLNESPTPPVENPAAQISPLVEEISQPIVLREEAIALLGIIAELPTRYSPGALAASVGVGRVGLAGWIIDRRLGADAEPDEETVKLAIVELCEKELVTITETRRLKATEAGARIWETMK
jgi:ribonuclease D